MSDTSTGYYDAEGEFQEYIDSDVEEEGTDDEPLTEDPEEETDNADTEDADYQEEEESDTEEEESDDEEVSDEESKEQVADYPDFIEDDLKVPEFSSERKELAWYRDNYKRTFDVYKSEKFQKAVIDHYDDILINKEKDVEQLKAVKEVFNGNPDLALKIFAPEGLAQRGISSQLSDDEINQLIDSEMKKTFGNNYSSKYDKDELIDTNSLSSKMVSKMQEIKTQISEHQAKSEQLSERYRPLNEEEINQKLEDDYNEHFLGKMAREDYDSLVEELKGRPALTMVDMHRLLRFDDYLDEAYRRGQEEGKKGVISSIKKAGKPLTVATRPRQEQESNKGIPDVFDLKRQNTRFY